MQRWRYVALKPPMNNKLEGVSDTPQTWNSKALHSFNNIAAIVAHDYVDSALLNMQTV